MVCVKKKAYKQQLEKKLSDWTCFLNNMYSCSFERKNKMIPYIKKIKNAGILNIIHQRKKWEKYIKNKNLTSGINECIYKIPFFILNNSFKKNFVSLNYITKNIKNIFTFISLDIRKKSKTSRYTEIFLQRNRRIFLYTRKNANKIFFTLHGIHFECKFFEKTNKICFFLKNLFSLKITYQILLEYYKHLSNFILKKNVIFCNSKFITHYIVETYDIFSTKTILVEKNYEFRQKNLVSTKRKRDKQKKIYYGYCDFFKKNRNIRNKFTWIFSKNVKMPFFSLTENLVLYNNVSQIDYSTVLKYLNLKFSFFEKKKAITHVFSTEKATCSLVCIPIKLSWIFDVIDNYSMLPTCLNWTDNGKKISINPFYLKRFEEKNEKINNLCFRHMYTKKRILEKEFSYKNVIWFIGHNFSLFTKKNLTKKKKSNYITILVFDS